MIDFTKSLGAELAPLNIMVNCVAPGWVDTEMCTEVFAEDPTAHPYAAQTYYISSGARIPHNNLYIDTPALRLAKGGRFW